MLHYCTQEREIIYLYAFLNSPEEQPQVHQHLPQVTTQHTPPTTPPPPALHKLHSLLHPTHTHCHKTATVCAGAKVEGATGHWVRDDHIHGMSFQTKRVLQQFNPRSLLLTTYHLLLLHTNADALGGMADRPRGMAGRLGEDGELKLILATITIACIGTRVDDSRELNLSDSGGRMDGCCFYLPFGDSG